MGIRFIYGRAGSGKSKFCLDQIEKKLSNGKDNKLIILVPEQYTFQSEQKLLDSIGERALLRAEVLSFKRMATRVFEACGGKTNRMVKNSGKNMLIYKLLKEKGEELKYFNKISKQQGFVGIVSKTITEFKKYKISEEMLEDKQKQIENNELKEKLQDLSQIYEEFNNRLHKEYIDGDDVLNILADKLKGCNLYDNAEIWIDEFTTFTPQQLAVINVLAKKCKTINITLCTDGGGLNEENSTDIFNAVKNTENRILREMEENNIGYLEPIDLNKKTPYRFINSEPLAHIEKNFFTYPFKIYNEPVNDIRVYKANNNYSEIEWVAQDILRLVRDEDYRFRDIAVVCRDIDNYDKITSVIFEEFNIPYFLDKKREILSNPLVMLMISALEILSSNWSYESVFKYLKSGLINMDQVCIDKLENYILARGIKGYRWTEDLFNTEEELKEEEVAMRELMDLVREPLTDLYGKIKGEKTVREYCVAIYEFLLQIKALETMEKWLENFNSLGLQDKIKEYSQVPTIVMEILDQAVEVLGDDKVDIVTFNRLLVSGFQEQEIGVIPMSLDQVNIGDIARIKGRDVKALYVVGVNDGILPSANKEEGILSDNDRNELRGIGLELASDTRSRAFEEQFMVYTALTISSEYLMITYPMADFEGKSLRPSMIIPRVKRIFKELKEESEIYNRVLLEDKYNKITAPTPTFNELIGALRRELEREDVEEYWAKTFKWFEENPEYNRELKTIFKGLTYSNLTERIPKEKVRKLYGNEDGRLLFSVSRLEKYSQCPFSYYVQYGLKAKDRKIYEFTAPDIGSFIHEIIDKFTYRVKKENILWSDLTKERCTEIVNDLVDNKLKQDTGYILNSNKKYQYFAERFKRTITKSVTILSEQMKRGEFEIYKSEFGFGDFKDSDPIKLQLNSGQEVQLVGRVDRIDKLNLDGETYIRIVDYKSGKKAFDLNELYNGLQIQLIVYLDAILKNSDHILKTQCMPGAILYFRVDDPIIKSKKPLDEGEIKEEVLKKLKMDGLLLKDAEVVKAMDNSMETYSLIIPAKFNKDGSFSSNSAVVTEEQFDGLRKFVNKKMLEICEDMLSGEVKIEPCKSSKVTYCDYCDYSAICQFDTSIKNNKYRIISKKSKDDLWEKIMDEETGEVK